MLIIPDIELKLILCNGGVPRKSTGFRGKNGVSTFRNILSLLNDQYEST